MNAFLIYLFLFVFWMQNTFDFVLTGVRGLSLQNLCLYLLLIAWLVTSIRRRKLVHGNNLNIYLILLLFVMTASIPIKFLLAEISEISLKEEIIILKNWADPWLFFFIIFNLIDNERVAKRLIYGLVVLMVLSTLIALLAMFDVTLIGSVELSHQGRCGAWGDSNQYAAFLVLFIPLVLSFAVLSRGVLVKTVTGAFTFIAFIGLVCTGSRGGTIAFLCSIFALGWILRRHGIIKGVRIPLIIFVAFASIIVSYAVAPSQLKETIQRKFDPTNAEDVDKFTSGRTKIWSGGIQLFMKSPIFGHGQQAFRPLLCNHFHMDAVSHNDYLKYLVNYGIIGFLLFVLTYIQIFRRISSNLRMTDDHFRRILYVSYIAGFIGYAVAMFGVNLYNSIRTMFWIYTAVVYKYTALESGE